MEKTIVYKEHTSSLCRAADISIVKRKKQTNKHTPPKPNPSQSCFCVKNKNNLILAKEIRSNLLP